MSASGAGGLAASTEAARTPGGVEATVLAFEGDLDLASLEDFEEALREATAEAAPVAVDLTGVRFIDSSGIHAVVRAKLDRAERDSALALVVAPGSAVERVIAMSGLADELGANPDRAAALASLDEDPA